MEYKQEILNIAHKYMKYKEKFSLHDYKNKKQLKYI